jgi:ribosome maturation factor RimP
MSLQNDIKALVSSVDLELFDTSIVNENEDTIFRVSVISTEMKDGKRAGVSLDKCVELTHLISPLLDVTPPVSGDYRLEVGTPGIERKLTTLRQFELSVGEKVSLVAAEKAKYMGLLTKVEGSQLFLEIDGEVVAINFNDVVKARTYFEW